MAARGRDVGGPAGPGRADQRQRPAIATTSTGGVAAPVDTGIDQAPLSVQVLDTNSEPLPTTDPSYQRIYYRDEHHQHAGHQPVPRPAGISTPSSGSARTPGRIPTTGPPVAAASPPPSTGSTTWRPRARIDQNIIGYLAINGRRSRRSATTSRCTPRRSPRSATDLGRQRHLAGRVPRLRAPTPAGSPRSPPSTSTGALTPAMYLDTTSGLQIGLLTAAAGDDAPCPTCRCSTPTGLPSTCWPPRHSPVSATAATLTGTLGVRPERPCGHQPGHPRHVRPSRRRPRSERLT